jgi:AcrR family transcriptional regulator
MESAQTETAIKRRASTPEVSHNLNGQRLGRKGRDTRDRIIAVAREIIDESDESQITISEVARRANLRMASLYLYFADLTELVLALLEPVMAEAEKSYLELLRTPWPDEELESRCLQFAHNFYEFWNRNSGVLHLRNTMADRKDRRMTEQRINAARPVIALLIRQMGHDPAVRRLAPAGLATVLYMGFERAVNIVTDRHFGSAMDGQFSPDVDHYMNAEARLFTLAIADARRNMPLSNCAKDGQH